MVEKIKLTILCVSRLAKQDYGGFETVAIRNASPNSLYSKADLFPLEQDVVEAMVAGTHAMIGKTEIAGLLVASHHKVNISTGSL